MKPLLPILLVFASAFSYANSLQFGCVKTRGRMVNGELVSGKGLPGAIVSIKGRTDIGVRQENGIFSFPVIAPNFHVDSITKNNYILLDADAASKTYVHTLDTIFFVMETPDQILQDRIAAERRLTRKLNAKLQARDEEIEMLLAENKITEQEYQQALQQLNTERSDNYKLISDMAERYSTLDYDQLDAFYRQVSYHIEQCEFVKADSLLKSRGNLRAQVDANKQQGQVITQKEQELLQAKMVHQHDIEELSKRCYSYYENFKMQHQNDSAAKYLKIRVELDSNNVGLIGVYVKFLVEYTADYDSALVYSQKALAIARKNSSENHPEVATSYNNIGAVYKSKGAYDLALKYHQKALQIRQQLFGESHPYIAVSCNNIGTIYEAKGAYDIALKYHQKALNIRKYIF